MGTADVTLYAQWVINTYMVTYDGNGSDGGTVPTDGTVYEEGATVTVAAAGTMTRTGYSFTGWNTAFDGSGTDHAAGSAFAMGTADVTLYAQWTVRWEDLGYASTGASSYIAMAIGTDNVPVVVSRDDSGDNKVHVMRWSNGTSWTDLGDAYAGEGRYISIAIGSDNKPVVSYNDYAITTKVQAKKWDNDTSWTDLGYASSGSGDYTSIIIDPSDNKPIVAFRDDGDASNRTRVVKWNTGTSWTDLGFPSSGYADWISLAVDPSDNKPVVAFREDSDASNRVHVMKWSTGTSWTDLGYPSSGWASHISLTIDPSDYKPVVAYNDAYFNKAVVKKWNNGADWGIVGGLVSAGEADHISIAIGTTDNKPVIVFRDVANGNKVHVMKWISGSVWTDFGYVSTGALTTSKYCASIAIDPADNKPIVVFRDNDNGFRAHVMKFVE